MPKNQFQRPLPITHANHVPRHGKPLPPPGKAPKRLGAAPAGTSAIMPSLDQLLNQQSRSR